MSSGRVLNRAGETIEWYTFEPPPKSQPRPHMKLRAVDHGAAESLVPGGNVLKDETDRK